MTDADKAKKERDIFRSFASKSSLDIDLTSIESRKPPEPDICCRIGGELVAFDLTQLVDEGFMKQPNLNHLTRDFIKHYYIEELSKTNQERFDKIYSGTKLIFYFNQESKLRNSKKKIKRAFELLLGQELPLSIKYNPILLPEIETINIRETELKGPLFYLSNFLWLGDPTKKSLMKKLNKKYGCDYPIELLVHTETSLLLPNWRGEVDRVVESKLKYSPFRKIWIFDEATEEVTYEYSL